MLKCNTIVGLLEVYISIGMMVIVAVLVAEVVVDVMAIGVASVEGVGIEVVIIISAAAVELQWVA